MKRYFLFFLLFFVFTAIAMEQDTALSVDFDDVISVKQKVGFWDYASAIPSIVFWRPGVLTKLLQGFAVVEKEGRDMSDNLNGAGNVIHAFIKKLKDDGYTDLSYYEPDLIDRATNPKPLQAVIDYLKKLKQAGYTLIGATNQDYAQNKYYRQKMKQKGADLDQLFDAIVVTRSNHFKDLNSTPINQDEPFTITEQNIFMLNDPKAVKPNAKYYKGLKRVAQKLKPGINLVVHVDDKKENVLGAENVSGVKAILFDLPDGSARKSTPEQLDNALKGYQEGLKELGIAIK